MKIPQPPWAVGRRFRINRRSPQAAGLVAWWPAFASAGASVLRDLARFFYDGSILGGTTWRLHYVLGPCLDFDGTDSYVNFGNVLGFTGAFSIAAWIKVHTTISGVEGRAIIAKDSVQTGGRQYSLQQHPYEYFRFGVSPDGSAWVSRDSQTAVTAGAWHFIVGVYEPSNRLDIFIDGVLDNGTLNNGPIPASIQSTTTPLHFGVFYASSSTFFNGLIGEVRFYDRALSADEVWQLYDPATRFDLYLIEPKIWPVVQLVFGQTVSVEALQLQVESPDLSVSPGPTSVGLEAGQLTSSALPISPKTAIIIQADSQILTVTANQAIVQPGPISVGLSPVLMNSSILDIATIVPRLVQVDPLSLTSLALDFVVKTGLFVTLDAGLLGLTVPDTVIVPGPTSVQVNQLNLQSTAGLIQPAVLAIARLDPLVLNLSSETTQVVPGPVSILLDVLTALLSAGLSGAILEIKLDVSMEDYAPYVVEVSDGTR